jgi:hypothetical protein
VGPVVGPVHAACTSVACCTAALADATTDGQPLAAALPDWLLAPVLVTVAVAVPDDEPTVHPARPASTAVPAAIGRKIRLVIRAP